MNITLAQTQKLLTGNHSFSQFGFSLLVTRLKGIYAKDQSAAKLQSCLDEINAFLGKYSAIMTEDFAVISKF